MLEGVVPIFHQWIQDKSIANHQLIDVADYRHVVGGPGVMLIAHEGNFSLDRDEAAGLYYYRKQRAPGDLHAQILTAIRTALTAAQMLELHVDLMGKARFRTDKIIFRANDQLTAPPSPATYQDAIEVLKKACPLFSVARFESAPAGEPVAVSILLPGGQNVRQLHAQLG